MSWFTGIFKKKLKNPHNFSKIMRNRERLAIFLPKDKYQAYKIVQLVAGLQTPFKETVFFVDNYSYPLFTKLSVPQNCVFKIFEDEQPPLLQAVVMCFVEDKAVLSFIKRCKDSTIVDINNRANMQFLPLPRNALELFQRFCNFHNLEIQSHKLDIQVSSQEIEITRQRFIVNRFPDFILEVSEKFSTRNLDNLIILYKQNFSANIYLSDKKTNPPNLINVNSINKNNLFDLFLLAKAADVFITDKHDVANLFGSLSESVVFLGDKQPEEQVYSFGMKDIFRMKEFLREQLKQKKT